MLSCSALRRAYRDVLRGAGPDVVFLEVDVPRDVLATRMVARQGHFMPPSLLDSQLATLEPLADYEAGARLDGTRPVAELVAAVRRALSC